MEKEADETPNSRLMSWYKECLALNIDYNRECRMYNRLAYFYLEHYATHDNILQAKAYFEAMERRGLYRNNPYEALYGGDEHRELVEVLLDGSHEDDISLYIEEYFKRLKEGRKAEHVELQVK